MKNLGDFHSKKNYYYGRQCCRRTVWFLTFPRVSYIDIDIDIYRYKDIKKFISFWTTLTVITISCKLNTWQMLHHICWLTLSFSLHPSRWRLPTIHVNRRRSRRMWPIRILTTCSSSSSLGTAVWEKPASCSGMPTTRSRQPSSARSELTLKSKRFTAMKNV